MTPRTIFLQKSASVALLILTSDEKKNKKVPKKSGRYAAYNVTPSHAAGHQKSKDNKV